MTYLSSAGVYGDQAGAICNELTPPDCSNNANALLASAEASVLSLNDASTQACVLRLGGIYGPGKDIPSYIRSAAGQPVRKNGNHINAWVHLHDIIRGVDFAFGRPSKAHTTLWMISSSPGVSFPMPCVMTSDCPL